MRNKILLLKLPSRVLCSSSMNRVMQMSRDENDFFFVPEMVTKSSLVCKVVKTLCFVMGGNLMVLRDDRYGA